MRLTGYKRANGGVGIRNHVLILSTIVCANHVAAGIEKQVPGAVSVTHQHGCAQIGADYEQTFRTLVGFAAHSNVFATVVVGLGCEELEAEKIAEAARQAGQENVAVVIIQKEGGTLKAMAKGAQYAREFMGQASQVSREEIRIEDIILATECGGSDACSGISANPSLGYCSDKIVELGGTAILAETTELFGAEHMLAERAADEGVRKRVFEVIDRMEKSILAMGVDLRGAQPSPGNMEGGITTIEEKSLGCVHKGGESTLQEVIDYAYKPSKKGLVWMDTPGHDIEQLVGMVAGGSQIVVFTTGRGTPTGSPIAPVIKVATNTFTYENMIDNMDVNAGTIVTGDETIKEVGERLFQEICDVINGKLTKAEILGHHEFGINRIGPTV
ncbi:MAG: UxaA family hydrolase [Desulfitobacteriaceae bacterium]